MAESISSGSERTSAKPWLAGLPRRSGKRYRASSLNTYAAGPSATITGSRRPGFPWAMAARPSRTDFPITINRHPRRNPDGRSRVPGGGRPMSSSSVRVPAVAPALGHLPVGGSRFYCSRPAPPTTHLTTTVLIKTTGRRNGFPRKSPSRIGRVSHRCRNSSQNGNPCVPGTGFSAGSIRRQPARSGAIAMSSAWAVPPCTLPARRTA